MQEQGLGKFERGTTPGRVLIPNLKPAPRKLEVEVLNREHKCDLKSHFKEFMSTTNTMKRARSFSQPREKNSSDREIAKRSGATQISNLDEEDQEEKHVEDIAETEKATRRPSRSGRAVIDSSCSGSERASTASEDSVLATCQDKPILDETDNRDSESSRKSSVTSIEAKLPPMPPRYKPSLEGSGTSSYYARVRTRAEGSKRKDSTFTDSDSASSAPSSGTVSRKFDASARKYRSKTIEVGFPVPPPMAEKPQEEEDSLAADQEVETILKETKKTHTNTEVYPSSNANKTPTYTTPSPLVKTPTSPSNSLKVTSETEAKSRLSPFNRFRSSLVMGSISSNRDSPRKSSMASIEATSPIHNGGGRQRTESETSSSKSSEKRSRFFYRKSRTGPLPGDSEVLQNPSSVTSSASNSTSNLGGSSHLTVSQEEVSRSSLDSRHAVRAKSEFSPRTGLNPATTAASAVSGTSSSEYTSTSGSGGPKDNLFMAAARKWASYDKPSYQTPFTRDNWKRSHRKFNYSRFLSYTRETFV